MNTYPSAERPALSTAEIASELVPFGVRLPEEKLSKIKRYIEILVLWNHKLSLTAIDDPREIVARHFGESIFGGNILPMNRGRLADVGTGGGFPGLPLKIAFPELEVTLIESNAKKAAFLRELIGDLALNDVQVFRGSYTEFSARNGRFDYVCCRALGDYRTFLGWAAGVLENNGRVVMWLGQEDSIRVSRAPGWVWELPVPIPESNRRVISIGRPKTHQSKP